jgi:uncharacterized protein YciI
MFIVLLRFSDNKKRASQFMEGHKEWIQRGFDDGVFLVTGSIQPSSGGAVIAHNTSLAALQERVNADPFVSENVVTAELIEIDPSRTDDRLAFLMD